MKKLEYGTLQEESNVQKYYHKNEKDFNGHNGFNREEFKKILEKYDFDDITFETVFNGTKIVFDKEVDFSLFLCMAKKC